MAGVVCLVELWMSITVISNIHRNSHRLESKHGEVCIPLRLKEEKEKYIRPEMLTVC